MAPIPGVWQGSVVGKQPVQHLPALASHAPMLITRPPQSRCRIAATPLLLLVRPPRPPPSTCR